MKVLIYTIIVILILGVFVSCAKKSAEAPEMEAEKTGELKPETKETIASIESQSEDYEPGFHEESLKELFAQTYAQKITWETADGQTITVERGELS